jgi:hypothetical protein
MKRTRRKARRPAPRAHARAVSRHSALPAVERLVELPLPPALNTERVRRSGAVALVDVEGQRLQLRFLRPSLSEDEPSTLTAPEEAALARGGVGAVSADETRLVEAQSAAAYQQLRAESLGVEEAARRLGVNTSRIRQRLAARSLYGVKDGNAWLLPAFQFVGNGLVPGIQDVLRRLPEGLSPLAVARWLTLPNPDLPTRDDEERPLSPRQWLLEGNPPGPAAELAAAL